MIVYFKDLVGDNVTGLDNKVFPSIAPESQALPYCTYHQIYNEPLKTLDGHLTESFLTFQFDFYANTYVSARTIANEWIEYIKDYSGLIGTYTISNTEILNNFDDVENISSTMRYKAIVELKFYIK